MNNQKPLQVGDILIGEFKILDVFGGEGKSGMGVVYLVENREFPFPIVLKTIQKNDLNSIERFRAEANTWISIGIHPNVVQAYFVREINEQLFIGAEYIAPDENERNTITDHLEQGGASNYNIVKWTAQFCYAMDFSISKGLKAHRDIKPDNLMVDEFGNLKVTDFGLAKAFYEFNFQSNDSIKISNLNLTSEGSFLGTLLFASPEQILDSSSIDFRSDIYSFGIVLYQLISLGGFPYSLKGINTQEDIAIMHLQEPLLKINHPLFSIVEKCLAKKPNKRYQTYGDLLNDLEKTAVKIGTKLPINSIHPVTKFRELYIQSLSYLELGNKEKAFELINEYLKYDKLDSLSWQLKGRILAETGKMREAINATFESYKLNPSDSKTLNNLGNFHLGIEEIDKAITYFLKAIQVNKFNAGAYMNLAIAFREKGEHSLATDAILTALKLSPDKNNTHTVAEHVALSAHKAGLYNQAISILEILANIDNNNIRFWANLAMVYQTANMKEDAIKCNEFILAKKPNDEDSLLCLATLYAEIGNYKKALSYCDLLIVNKIALSKAISFKIQIMKANGQDKEAIKFIETAINNGYQNNDSLWSTLATLYQKYGNNTEALRCFRQAKSILMLQKSGDKKNLAYIEGKISVLKFVEEHSPEVLANMFMQIKDKEK